MSHSIPVGNNVEHFDPDLPHHRAWLQAVLEQLVAHEPQALEEGGTLRRLWTDRQTTAGSGQAPVADIPAAGGEPWTIGWDSTRDSQGRPVKEGDRIGQEQAVGGAFSEGVALLRSRLEDDWRRLALGVERFEHVHAVAFWAEASCRRAYSSRLISEKRFSC